ncbi:MAG: DUF4445 domain-containing protein, partial [Deltaproteobacteria bacterium]|nr:DUF4445 domain-containing protein [Deltaproteobacteria bacterium]
MLGIAFDIGTTTIVGSVLELPGCVELGALSFPNPQVKWGKDVLSRVQRVVEDPSALKTLQAEVIRTCNRIIQEITIPTHVKKVVAVGNTVMEHLFLGVSPASMARPPYRPSFKEPQDIPASQIGLEIDPSGRVYTFPLIGGFIGGDTIGVILSTEIHKAKGVRLSPECFYQGLAIDIGTNSEIVLASNKGLYAVSCAAGPAFEGGSIKHGMIAGRGAIQGMRIDSEGVLLDVIGDVTPRGICGSGLIDIVSQLLRTGVID